MRAYKDALYVGGTEWKRVDRFTYLCLDDGHTLNVKGYMSDPEEVIFDYLLKQYNNPAVEVLNWKDPLYSLSSEGYYNYLCDALGVYSDTFNPIGCQGSFSEVARCMWLTKFNFSNQFDANRIENIRKLRLNFASLFSNYDNYDAIDSRMKPNVLEMIYIIGMIGERESTKQFDINGRWHKDFIKVFFRTIVCNLGISDITDDIIADERALGERGDISQLVKIYDAVERANNRDYDYYGQGGFFPDHSTRVDLRTKDLLWQMRRYIEQITYQTVIEDTDF